MLRKYRTRGFTILDRVYEHVTLPPLVVAAVDTPAFQRLRSLYQLGASSFLYPSAVHTRFEHSIGVAHMARILLLNIQRNQPDLGLSEVDVELVMLAGLFHDIGHGPFSHLFEDVISRRCGIQFNHEDMSERIARRVLSDLVTQTQVDVVTGLMRGRALPGIVYGEIVSNKRNGIDVDRLDYFLRDSMCCFGKATFDVRIHRLFNSARLVCEGGQWQLAFEQKLALTLREIFMLRAKLHKNVYQHQVTKAVGHMIGDIIHAAVPHLKVGGHTLVECAQDETLFLKLGDWILEAIGASEDPQLAEARAILHRLHTRDIYRIVYSSALDIALRAQITALDWSAAILEHADPSLPLDAADFIPEVVVVNQGKGGSDPLESVLFFNPKRPSQPLTRLRSAEDLKPSSPLFTPVQFEERTLMVFERRPTNGAVQRACERLCADPAYASFFTESLPFYNINDDDSGMATSQASCTYVGTESPHQIFCIKRNNEFSVSTVCKSYMIRLHRGYHRMLRRSSRLLVRLPKSRRPRERPWEIFNVRDFGYHEGSQNYLMWLCAAALFASMLGFEVYQQIQRILQRGDTCTACEAARAHYRKRVEERERETEAQMQHNLRLRQTHVS